MLNTHNESPFQIFRANPFTRLKVFRAAVSICCRPELKRETGDAILFQPACANRLKPPQAGSVPLTTGNIGGGRKKLRADMKIFSVGRNGCEAAAFSL
jgi:hypothetical protein